MAAFKVRLLTGLSILTSVFAIQTCDQSSSIPSKLGNIGYLGRGYDIVRANPRPFAESMDTGFVSSVFDMTKYDEGRLTADGQHMIPDFTDVVECTACQMSYQSSVITGSHSYKSSLSRQITGETGFDVFGLKFSFRASGGYLQTTKETSDYRSIFVDTSASCIIYCADLRLPLKPSNLDAAFIEAVRQLPTNSSDPTVNKAYYAFLRKFGTHAVSGMKAGSLFWSRMAFSSEGYAKAEQESSNLDIPTSAGFWFLSASFNYQSTSDKHSIDTFSKLSKGITFHSTGAGLPTSDVESSPYDMTIRWMQESKKTPMPVEFRLVPIPALLQQQFFPNMTDIDQKRDLLLQLVDNGGYCNYLAGVNSGAEGKVNCAEEQPDNVLGKKPKAKSNFGGTYYKTNVNGIEDLPNQLTDLFDCPDDYSAILIGGGPPLTVSLSQPYTCCRSNSLRCADFPKPQMPGFFYMCTNGPVDPQGAFLGFVKRVNENRTINNDNGQNQWAIPCPSANRLVCPSGEPDLLFQGVNVTDNRALGGGQYEILVAYYGVEYVYASYTPVPGAFVGGFYMIHSNPHFNWNNPRTGVTSCPNRYKAHKLFSQKNTDANNNIYPFDSYVCLLQ